MKTQFLCSTRKTPSQVDDFGHRVQGSGPGRRVQKVVPCACGFSFVSDYPFENLDHLASELEASEFSHAIYSIYIYIYMSQCGKTK